MEGLRAYFDGQRDGIDESLRCAVASEYADLFVGPRPPQAPMYESVYLGTPKRLFTEQTMLVRHFYARCGLAVVKSDKVPDDYLPYELELISSLALREADAAGRGDVRGADEARELQLEFLRAHLGRWMEPFSCRVIQAESSDFYAALVAFARDFIADDETYLAHSVDEAGMSVTEGALR
jgi:TorA maturation chaperone TorD